MKRIIEEILDDIESPTYLPTDTDALFLIANYLKQIAESLAQDPRKTLEF